MTLVCQDRLLWVCAQMTDFELFWNWISDEINLESHRDDVDSLFKQHRKCFNHFWTKFADLLPSDDEEYVAYLQGIVQGYFTLAQLPKSALLADKHHSDLRQRKSTGYRLFISFALSKKGLNINMMAAAKAWSLLSAEEKQQWRIVSGEVDH